MIDLTRKLEDAKAKAVARDAVERAISDLDPEVSTDLLVEIIASRSVTAKPKRAARPDTPAPAPVVRGAEVADKIRTALASGPRTVDDVSEAIHGSGVTGSEIKRNRARTANALSHMKSKGQVTNNGRGTWALSAGNEG